MSVAGLEEGGRPWTRTIGPRQWCNLSGDMSEANRVQAIRRDELRLRRRQMIPAHKGERTSLTRVDARMRLDFSGGAHAAGKSCPRP